MTLCARGHPSTLSINCTRAEQVLPCRVGCDACGLYPIKGRRYTCTDCPDKVGFDLCGKCHDKELHITGRFNQQHTPGDCHSLTPLIIPAGVDADDLYLGASRVNNNLSWIVRKD